MTFVPNADEIVCSKCDKVALLRVVVPSEKPDHEEWCYQCFHCGHTETLLSKIKR